MCEIIISDKEIYWNLNFGVTSIGSCAFSDCVNLSSITISGSVTSIGNGAFASCLSMSSIIIPSGITSIGMQAFDYCIRCEQKYNTDEFGLRL